MERTTEASRLSSPSRWPRYAWRLVLLLVLASAVCWVLGFFGTPIDPYRSYYTWRNEAVLRALPQLPGATEESRTINPWCHNECALLVVPDGYGLSVSYRLNQPRTPAAIRDFVVTSAPAGWEVHQRINQRAEFAIAYCRGDAVVEIAPNNVVGFPEVPAQTYSVRVDHRGHRAGHTDACDRTN